MRRSGDAGQRVHEPRLPALRGPFDVGADGAVDDHAAPLEVDVLPAQREQFAEAHAGVGRNAVELRVLAVLPRPPRLLIASIASTGRVAHVRRRPRGVGERLDLVRLVVVEHGCRQLAPLAGCVDRRRVGVLAAGVGEHRREDLAVLVDRPCAHPASFESAQEGRHMLRRHARAVAGRRARPDDPSWMRPPPRFCGVPGSVSR